MRNKIQRLIDKRNALADKIKLELETLWPVDSRVAFMVHRNQKTPSTGVVVWHKGPDAVVGVMMDKLSRKEAWLKSVGNHFQHTVKRVYWNEMITIETTDDINRLLNAMEEVTFEDFGVVLKETIKADDNYIHRVWCSWCDNPLGYMRSRSPISQGEALLKLVESKIKPKKEA